MITAMHILDFQARGLPDSDNDNGGATSTSTSGDGGTDQVIHPGSLGHRMIGVIIVLVLALLLFIFWLLKFSKWPRRTLRRWWCMCLPTPPDLDGSREVDSEPQRQKGELEQRHEGDGKDRRPQSYVILEMEAHRMAATSRI